jgi:hypothetical protein
MRPVAYMEEMKNAYKILFRKPEGNRLLRGTHRRWEYNIEIDFKELG